MKNIHHQTFVIIRSMTYIHVKLALFIYLFRPYKRVRDKTKIIFRRQKKNQNKIYKCTKNRIK